ncbi:MAG: uroporphyrinogen-III synthase [Pyrinomonadaceae bacterium]
MTVIVVRRDDNFSQMLRDADIDVNNIELVTTEVLDDLSEFENSLASLDSYDGIFFTSPVAALVFIDRIEPRLKPTLYALGKRAAAALSQAGFVVRTIPGANTAHEMLTAFGEEEFAGKDLLFVRGEHSMRTIPEKLAGIADIDEIAVYRTIEVELAEQLESDIRTRLTSGQVELACFFSPSAVEAFEKRFGASVSAAAIGETTAARARELGFTVELVASQATNHVFARELIEILQRKQIV